jgi:hypothetical protein
VYYLSFDSQARLDCKVELQKKDRIRATVIEPSRLSAARHLDQGGADRTAYPAPAAETDA